MGYLVNAVQTGLEYAEKYHVQQLVNKVRTSSNAVDMTLTKVDSLIREQGTPIVEKIDVQLDSRVAQAQEKKEEVLKIIENCREKKTQAVEYAQGKLTVVTDPVYERTAQVKAKVNSTKQYVYEQAEEKKEKLYEKAQEAVTTSKAQIDLVQTKASSSKAYAEKQLLSGAQKVDKVLKVDERLGSPYTEKAASYAVKTADRALGYSFEKAQLLVNKSLTVPLTLKERMEKSVAFAKDKTSKTKAFVVSVPTQALVLLLAAKVQLFALPLTILTQKDAVQASFQNGTLPQDAQKQYARALKFAQEQAASAKEQLLSWVPTLEVTPYVEQAKQAVTQVTTKAKAEVSKLQPFFKQVTDKALSLPLLEQAKGKASALFGSFKAKAA